jgi:site-specific recombinase XerC
LELEDLSDLTAAQVVGSVQRLVPSLCRKRAKVMTSALRSFLRYARYQDFIRSDLAACVPCVADWSVASIPKGLPIEHVKRVLASCNRKSAIRRDYAILLLLARLGLRAGEVAALTLEDFDWKTGRLTLRGKGDRYAWTQLGNRAIPTCAIIFRQQFTQMTDIVDKTHKLYKAMGATYVGQRSWTWTFPSGAKIRLAHISTEQGHLGVSRTALQFHRFRRVDVSF